MTQEFVTLPREVVEQALEALFMYKPMVTGVTFQHGLEAMQALRAALDRLQAEQDPTPNGATHIQLQQGAFYKRVDGKWYVWSLMKNGESHRWYISPGTAESCLEPLATTPKQKHEPLTIEQPQANQPAMTPIAQRKLDSLLTDGYTISGYSVYHERKHQHGFVTGAGLVGWWKPEGMEYPKPLGEQKLFAWISPRALEWGTRQSEKVVKLTCEAQPEYDFTEPLYTRQQPKREPLTDEEIDKLCPQFDDPMRREMWIIGFKAAHNIK